MFSVLDSLICDFGRLGRMRVNTQVRLLNSLVGLAGLVNSDGETEN